MRTVTTFFAIVLGLASPLTRAADCVREGDEIAVVGALSRESFAGPPNYESVDRGDRAETYWILRLSEPLLLCRLATTGGQSQTLGSVVHFQLVLRDGELGMTQALIARYARVRGRLYMKGGDRHLAAVIEVEDVRPATRRSFELR